MMSKKHNKLDAEQLFGHAAYLEEELAALKKVISAVPYEEKPVGQHSIIEMIMEIYFAQNNYYGPVIKRLFSDVQPEINDLSTTQLDPNISDLDESKPEEIIDEVIKSRTKLLATLNQIPKHDWERKGIVFGKKTTMLKMLDEMIQFERAKFKEIAHRVLVIDASRSMIKPSQP
ncbi:MAG: hypothetical protein WD267_08535 [Balneolales bacterium]